VRLLLDTHALIWAVDDPAKLSSQVTVLLQDSANELLLSAATIWEIAINIGLAKLELTMPYRQWMDQAIADLGGIVLPITAEYADIPAVPGRHLST
jgi:PIN domain nuclease of toxin-antitoxin system